MFGGDRDRDIVCAISTPPGTGGIHVIRVSGKDCLKLVKKSAPFLPIEAQSHRAYFGNFFLSSNKNSLIDEVLITFFQHGRSFTGEESVEISCHGSPFISSQIVKSLIHSGARLADRGEFTYRAFINGRIDLVQAESILDLIQSESKKAAEISLKQLKGELSDELKIIGDLLVAFLAQIEIAIDFSTEDIEVISQENAVERVENLIGRTKSLLESYSIGKKIRDGFEAVLIGDPNVGKSSLLNRVLGEEKAIVTDVPGTTRDLIQDSISINGTNVTLVDSAGLRESSDFVESIGIERTRAAIKKSDLVLVILSCEQSNFEPIFRELPMRLEKVVFVVNKKDKSSESLRNHILLELRNELLKLKFFQTVEELEKFVENRCIFVSAFDSEAKHMILGLIEKTLNIGSMGNESVLSQVRHYENLQRVEECLERTKALIEEKASPEFLALELKESFIRIQEILGERFDDQVLDRVFSEFCIGK